ncbi:MAG: hypothetical protein A3K03_00760 [Bdellovibrionales bacterium RIFOXYD1_FULL_44_7]|nr:MAG: hypothetical protein A3K03_00760 [Bdellovibrionales bacterium RIFOXYD1_FULL_44_7]
MFSLVRFFPYWGLPVMIVCAELAWYYHRKRDSTQYIFWGFAAVITVLIVCWIGFRGDLYSDQWVRAALYGG